MISRTENKGFTFALQQLEPKQTGKIFKMGDQQMTVFQGSKVLGALGAAVLGLGFMTGPVLADDNSVSYSATLTGTSDYVFRGISNRLERPALQGSIDASYNIFYVGAWASGNDFVPGSSNGPFSGDSSWELDLYAGITPKLGPVSFDLGVIWYLFPNADDDNPADPTLNEYDFVEFKLGASVSPVTNLTTGVTWYYSPDFFNESGDAHAIEISASYELPKIHIVTPSISGAWGTQLIDEGDDYQYWNAGVGLAAGNVSLDFRYWDTDISGGLGGLADERFVFTASVTVP